jgi:uncharacterized membrane protein YhiD involved in acid resistance
MEKLLQVMQETPLGGGYFDVQGVLLSLVLAFVLGQVLAWVYYVTHSGLSYSRSFVQSLILITMVIAMVMSVIADNIITAVGLMGALAIVRFRNIIKDTRDIAFIFSALVIGMATGSHKYLTAILGTTMLCLVILYLFYTDFGTHQPHNGFLRFSLKGQMGPSHPATLVLSRFCGNYTLLSRQETGFGGAAEYAYQILIKNTDKNEQLLSELEQVEGIDSINLTMQEKLLEV